MLFIIQTTVRKEIITMAEEIRRNQTEEQAGAREETAKKIAVKLEKPIDY